MKVAKDMVVGLAYQLRNDDGILVDQSTAESPLLYLHGHEGLINALEQALEGRAVGESFDIAIAAAEGYGEYDDNLVQRVPKEVFTGVDTLEVGMRFLAETDQGPVPVEITEVGEEDVVVDGNHMLAGQNLNFHVEVISLRAATEEELQHGHIHGDDTHEHGGCCGGGGCGGHGHEHGGCGSHDKPAGDECQGNGGCGCKH
ncbi:MAG: peptidylprolyl isomerase [Enterobacteriaceae bacterium]